MRPSVRIPLVIAVTAVAISLGIAGVNASTECVRFIQKKVHHHVSLAQAERWAEWDKAHPNWHPKKKSPTETMAQLDFACKVPLEMKPVDGKLPTLTASLFELPLVMLPPEEAPPVEIATETPPPTLPEDTPSTSIVSPPIYAPPYPTLFGIAPIPAVVPPPAATPEPSTWMMLGTALFAMAGLVYRRRMQPARAFARARS